MIVQKTSPENLKAAVKAAVFVLRRGGVIAYPTETTYGLGCDPRNAKAVARIYRIKGREKKKPFLLVAADVGQVRMVAKIGAHDHAPVRKVMRKNWPGPLTLVLPARAHDHAPVPKIIAPQGQVAIRVSSAQFVRDVCRAFGGPIVSTSANRSGEPEARSGRAVMRIFAGRGTACRAPTVVPDLLIDIGSLPRRKPSTVARVREDGTIEILRQGAVRLGLTQRPKRSNK